MNGKALIALTLATSMTAGAQNAVIKRMHDAYAGKWYKTLTFVQSTIITRATGVTDTTTWYETLSGADKLRIDQGLPTLGNGTMYKGDSTYGVRNGALTRVRAGSNPFLPLIMGVYLQPTDVTEKQLRGYKFDLAQSTTSTWHGRPVVVVGVNAVSDTVTPQFWIDTERLVAVRFRGTVFGAQVSDVDLGGYEKVGQAWLATRVRIATGAQVQMEEYRDWKANVAISEALFDVAQWKSAPHWAK